MTTSTKPSPISAAAAPSSRCARRSTPPRTPEEDAMNKHVNLPPPSFVIAPAAAGPGLAIGFDLPPGGPAVVRAADGSPEVNVWVVIRPDDTTVIRIARSEMGQGTLTGL